MVDLLNRAKASVEVGAGLDDDDDPEEESDSDDATEDIQVLPPQPHTLTASRIP